MNPSWLILYQRQNCEIFVSNYIGYKKYMISLVFNCKALHISNISIYERIYVFPNYLNYERIYVFPNYLNISIWSIYPIQSGTTPQSQSEPGINSNTGVTLHSPELEKLNPTIKYSLSIIWHSCYGKYFFYLIKRNMSSSLIGSLTFNILFLLYCPSLA